MELESAGSEPSGSHFLSPDNPYEKGQPRVGGICAAAECDRPLRARGLCSMHWRRYSKHGTTDERPPKRIPPSERFWAKVDKSGECWLWTGALVGPSGYGAFGIFGSKTILAHRFAWEEANGPIPDGRIIDHICHVRECVNLSHLRMATQKQNLENRKGPQNNSRSGIRGVTQRPSGRWLGQAGHYGGNYRTSLYDTAAEAEAAVIDLRLQLHTHNYLDRNSPIAT